MIKQTNKQKPHPISRLHSSLGQGVSLTSNQKKKKKKKLGSLGSCQARWHMPLIPALGRQTSELEASLAYRVSSRTAMGHGIEKTCILAS